MTQRLPNPASVIPIVAAAGVVLLSQAFLVSAVRAEVLYSLDTQCSLKGGEPQPCTVEAKEEEGATLYRHTIGDRVELIRIREEPARMSRWDADSESWTSLTSAGVLFSSNTICFNGRDLCVVNPNYLNSIVEEKPEVYEGRDLLRVKVGPDGRINLHCFDEACEEVK